MAPLKSTKSKEKEGAKERKFTKLLPHNKDNDPLDL